MKLSYPVAACALLLAAPAAAVAQDPPVGLGTATSATAKLSSPAPGAVSDLALRVTGTAPPAGVKLAPALRQTVTLPAGSRVRLPSPGSRVGTGLAVGDLNGSEVRFPLVVTAAPKALVFSAGDQSFRATVSGRRLVFTVPTAGGALVPKLFTAALADAVRNPATCPKSGKWTATIAFQALTAPENGALFGPVQSMKSTSRCTHN